MLRHAAAVNVGDFCRERCAGTSADGVTLPTRAVAAVEAPMAEAPTGSNGGREAKDDFEALRSDLDTLRQDFATLVSTLQAEGLALDLQTAGQQRLRSTERMIQEQPLMSVATAFATGLIVGRLLNR
jgi:ElaB/YqjD/DUF883 family membrane-anchored ribosome-binding protein